MQRQELDPLRGVEPFDFRVNLMCRVPDGLVTGLEQPRIPRQKIQHLAGSLSTYSALSDNIRGAGELSGGRSQQHLGGIILTTGMALHAMSAHRPHGVVC